MSDTVISVENLSKYYPSTALRPALSAAEVTGRLGVIGGYTLRDDVDRLWARLRSRPDPLLKIGQEDHSNRQGEEFRV